MQWYLDLARAFDPMCLFWGEIAGFLNPNTHAFHQHQPLPVSDTMTGCWLSDLVGEVPFPDWSEAQNLALWISKDPDKLYEPLPLRM